jgi:hypothetical protein
LWWSFNNGLVSFGFGDLNESDFCKIFAYVTHPSHEGDLVFTAWDENHGGILEKTVYPIVQISLKDGITFPHREAVKRIMQGTDV